MVLQLRIDPPVKTLPRSGDVLAVLGSSKRVPRVRVKYSIARGQIGRRKRRPGGGRYPLPHCTDLKQTLSSTNRDTSVTRALYLPFVVVDCGLPAWPSTARMRTSWPPCFPGFVTVRSYTYRPLARPRSQTIGWRTIVLFRYLPGVVRYHIVHHVRYEQASAGPQECRDDNSDDHVRGCNSGGFYIPPPVLSWMLTPLLLCPGSLWRSASCGPGQRL